MSSDWYRERLAAKQAGDRRLWERHVSYLQEFLAKPSYTDEADRLGIEGRLAEARATLEEVKKPEYLTRIEGTLGTDPLCCDSQS